MPLSVPVMKMAVPGTRGTRSETALRNVSSSSASLLTRSDSNARPRFQVVRIRKITRPTASGNQPPCAILVRLAAKKLKSTNRNSPITPTTTIGFHFHSSDATTASRHASMIMVPVTAMP